MSVAPTAVWPLSGFGDEIDPDPAVQAAVLLALGREESLRRIRAA